jgi:hypothetical protein
VRVVSCRVVSLVVSCRWSCRVRCVCVCVVCVCCVCVVGCGVVSRARFVVRFFVDSVRNNQLTSLPRSLDLATNLKVLDVSTNKLQFLNCNLSPLIFLKELGNIHTHTTRRQHTQQNTHTHTHNKYTHTHH